MSASSSNNGGTSPIRVESLDSFISVHGEYASLRSFVERGVVAVQSAEGGQVAYTILSGGH